MLAFIPATLRVRYVLVVVALLLIIPPANGQTVLRWKLREGDRFGYAFGSKIVQKMDVGKLAIQLEFAQNIDTYWIVGEIDKEGIGDLQVVVSRYRIHIDANEKSIRETMEVPEGGLDYDSKTDKVPNSKIGSLLGRVARSLVDAKCHIYMDVQGNVKDVKLPERLTDVLADDGGDQLIPPFNDILSEQWIKTLLVGGGIQLRFPEGPVSNGKSWTSNRDWGTQDELGVAEDTWTYLGRRRLGDRELDKIDLESTLKVKPRPGAPTMTLKSGTGKGTAWFDNETGRMIESAFEYRIVRELRIEDNVAEMIADASTYTKLITYP